MGIGQFNRGERRSQFDSLAEVWIDSGIVNKDLIERVQTYLCRNVITCYSSNESGRIAFANWDAIADVPNAVGFVAPYATVEIVDESDQRVGLGEVFAANNPRQTTEAANVWCYPGVLGRLNSDGILCISTRLTA